MSVHQVDQVLAEHGRGPPGGATPGPRPPGRPGDVQVSPVVVLGEAGQQAGRRHRPSLGAADVGQVGKIAVQLLLVVVPQRHGPAAVAGARVWPKPLWADYQKQLDSNLHRKSTRLTSSHVAASYAVFCL